MSSTFETDADGKILAFPLMGWDAAVAMKTALLLRLKYAKVPKDLETGGCGLPLLLTPQQCMDLSEQMRKHAEAALAPKPDSPPN